LPKATPNKAGHGIADTKTKRPALRLKKHGRHKIPNKKAWPTKLYVVRNKDGISIMAVVRLGGETEEIYAVRERAAVKVKRRCGDVNTRLRGGGQGTAKS